MLRRTNFNVVAAVRQLLQLSLTDDKRIVCLTQTRLHELSNEDSFMHVLLTIRAIPEAWRDPSKPFVQTN